MTRAHDRTAGNGWPYTLTIEEVIAAVGGTDGDVTPRTIHYYVQRGVVDPPRGRGARARYHVDTPAEISWVRGNRQARLTPDELRDSLDVPPEEDWRYFRYFGDDVDSDDVDFHRWDGPPNWGAGLDPDRRYTIAEAADMSGLSRRQIKYHRQHLQHVTGRTRATTYGADDVITLRRIAARVRAAVTLAGLAAERAADKLGE